ncbi:MAG: hypothetical protein AAF677_18420, partial [Pseudomonadota bacterium]
GIGAVAGATAGGLALSPAGQGAGRAFAILGGVLGGLIIGTVAEQVARNRTGVEYTLVLEDGRTLMLVQDVEDGEPAIPPGARVLLQYGRGFTRVIPADTVPEAVDRPTGLTVLD